MVGSPVGGMDIEHVAETQPEKIFKVKTAFQMQSRLGVFANYTLFRDSIEKLQK
jgi:succinyl-CoA synthetase beta subunit